MHSHVLLRTGILENFPKQIQTIFVQDIITVHFTQPLLDYIVKSIEYRTLCMNYVCNNIFFSRVMTLREHNRWVVKVHLQKGSEGNIVSAR